VVKPKLGTPAHRLLLIASRGPVDLDTLAARLHPPPRLASTAGYREWRADYIAWEAGLPAAVRATSRLVGRLREAGYIEPAKGGPRVMDDVPDPLTPEWWRERRRALDDVPEEGDYDPARGDTAPCDVLAGMVARARAGAATVAEVVGTSGHAWEVYAQACEAEVFMSPRVVRVTAAGINILGGERG
jgi:hypothetical protein